MVQKEYFLKETKDGGSGLYNTIHGVNGSFIKAQDFIKAIETATGRDDLRYASMITWSDVIPWRGIPRKIRAWCPHCFNEWQQCEKTIYEPLLWSLDPVKICLEHCQLLNIICPVCQQENRVLGKWSRTGFCEKCGGWLGVTSNTRDLRGLPLRELDFQKWVVKQLAELLTLAPKITVVLRRETVAKNLSVLVAKMGNHRQLSDRLGIYETTIYSWSKGLTLPQLDKLLWITFILQFPLAHFLINELTPETKIIFSYKTGGPIKKIYKTFNQEEARENLSSIAEEYPPPSLYKVIGRFGYRKRDVYTLLPELCRQISERYTMHQKSERLKRLEKICKLVVIAVSELQSAGVYPSKRSVEKFVGQKGALREKEVLEAWRHALVENQIEKKGAIHSL